MGLLLLLLQMAEAPLRDAVNLAEVVPQVPKIPDTWLTLIYWVLATLAAGFTASITAIWAAGQKICSFLAEKFFVPIVQRHDKFSSEITEILDGVKSTIEKQGTRTESLEKGVAELREKHRCKYNDDNHKGN
jgi:hypothetical protein